MPVTKQDDQNSKPDGRFRCGDRENKENKNLPMNIIHKMGKGDEVHIDRQQHQFDTHQQNDDIFAVDKYAGHGNAEQYGRED
jgi:hypothetical protein